jgi:hypothetical protein
MGLPDEHSVYCSNCDSFNIQCYDLFCDYCLNEIVLTALASRTEKSLKEKLLKKGFSSTFVNELLTN